MHADKFVQYELSTHGSREEPQPRCILLESQLESLKHHFVHWNLSGPTPIVQCQVSKRSYSFNLYPCSAKLEKMTIIKQ